MRPTLHPPLAFVALLILSAPVATAQPSSGPPCSTAEHKQFDFWIGDWVVHSEAGDLAGTNRIERTLNGCVITEDWQGNDGSIGRSFNMFYRLDGKWHQTWVDGNGGRLDLTGGWKDGRMVLAGRMPGRDGGRVLHEIAWTPRPDGTVRQHWRGSTDGGKTWQDYFVGIYSRRQGG